MTVYLGEYADLYDLFYAEKSYDQEVAVVDAVLRENAAGPSDRLLEVACGTGQHAVRFAARGWQVTGVDLSHDMLAKARTRPGAEHVAFLEQDMRSLDVPGAPFDAVTCLFDSIGYAVTNEGISAALHGMRSHLRPDGLFVAEFWHAPPMLRSHDPVRVREWQTAGGRVVRVSRTRLDVVAQLAHVDYDVITLRPDGTYGEWKESHLNRYFLVQEMEMFLREAGLEPLRWLAGFDTAAAIDDSTWHVVVVARAAGKG